MPSTMYPEAYFLAESANAMMIGMNNNEALK